MNPAASTTIALSTMIALTVGCGSSSRSAVTRQALECGVDIRGAVVDVELLGESSTALGNSGHWSHRVTIKSDKLDSVLSQMNHQHGEGETRAPIVSNMNLTIDSRNAEYWAFADLGHGGILVLADPEHSTLELVSYW